MITVDRQSMLNLDISRCENRQQFMQVVGRVVREFGLSHVSILTAPGPNDALLAPLALESTIPHAFVREFDRNRFLHHCPMLPRVSDSIVPCCWHLDSSDADLGYDCPEPMNELLRRFGLVMGVIFPLNSVDGTRHFVRYDGDRSPLMRMELNELAMITIHAFDAFDRMRRAEQSAPVGLSAREIEVVRWTAQGKTSVEIGQILSLSDHTVNAYLTNAMRKLDCVNRTQLVAKAIRTKLIN